MFIGKQSSARRFHAGPLSPAKRPRMLQAIRKVIDTARDTLRDSIAPDPLASQEGGTHYKGMRIQPVEFIHANDIPYLEGNVIKYVCRHRAKGGIDDLRKAQHYIELLIAMEYKREASDGR